MKKMLLAVVLILSASLVQAEEKSGFYAGAGLGFLGTSKQNDLGLGITLKGGIALDEVLKGFGAQVEINKSIIAPQSGNFDIDVLTLATYATFDIVIPDSGVTLRPRIGVIVPNLQDRIDSRSVIFSSGFGAFYDLDESLRLYADYTVLGEAISNYSAGVEFKF